MGWKFGIALAICSWAASAAFSQVVRFETSLGEFDMVLNPTTNPLLFQHVDNMLQYVEELRYQGSWINRADTGFVLQMGGFFSHTRRPPPTVDSTRPVFAFDPIQGEPAATIDGLSNTVGTVSLALSGLPTGGTNQDSGSSSFFINLTSNTFLDANFTVFAAIPDMTVVNQIMALTTIDRTTDDMFGADPGNLGFTDVPVMDNGFQVFIKRAFVISDTMAIARATAGVESIVAQSAAMAASATESLATSTMAASDGGVASSSLAVSTVVPEPSSIAMALVALMATARLASRRRAR